ncbi:TrbI/VirB10 family protein, partial [Xanthomonas sacchari]
VQPAEPVQLAEQPSLPPLPPMPTDTDAQMQSAPRQERGPSLLERRMAGLQQQDAGGQGLGGMMPGQEQGGAPMQQEQETSAKPIANPDGLLVRGTYIRCVLETRIITDFPGFTSCIITEPVYSINGRRLLLPKGSKILGQYGPAEPTGPRMQVVWDRITTPTGIDVTLVGPGVDNLGSAGHPGQYSAHWASRISSALMISLLSDAFKWAAAEHGPKTTTTGLNSGIVTEQPYESNTAQSIQRLADQALDRRRPATVTINQGTIVNVYVAKDVDFTAVLPR